MIFFFFTYCSKLGLIDIILNSLNLDSVAVYGAEYGIHTDVALLVAVGYSVSTVARVSALAVAVEYRVSAVAV